MEMLQSQLWTTLITKRMTETIGMLKSKLEIAVKHGAQSSLLQGQETRSILPLYVLFLRKIDSRDN